MKIKPLFALIPCIVFFFALLSCGSDNETPPSCDEFTSADSTCYCSAHPDDLRCNSLSFSIAAFTENTPDLTPHPSNGTIWTKGFAIGKSIYVIDRESTSPHAFWKFEIDKPTEEWKQQANFPGTDYGLTGSANGKGYASSYASNKFWEYNPASNEWTPLTDLPFSPGETHWVEYNGKFYVPNHNGIYEFTASTKSWLKISEQTSSGFGSIFLVGDDMYWFNINNDYMSHFNLASKAYDELDLPDDFGYSVAFNSPFTIDGRTFLIVSTDVWIFDNDTKTWSLDEDGLESGSAYGDDVFVIEGKVYLIDNGTLKLLDIVPE